MNAHCTHCIRYAEHIQFYFPFNFCSCATESSNVNVPLNNMPFMLYVAACNLCECVCISLALNQTTVQMNEPMEAIIFTQRDVLAISSISCVTKEKLFVYRFNFNYFLFSSVSFFFSQFGFFFIIVEPMSFNHGTRRLNVIKETIWVHSEIELWQTIMALRSEIGKSTNSSRMRLR